MGPASPISSSQLLAPLRRGFFCAAEAATFTIRMPAGVTIIERYFVSCVPTHVIVRKTTVRNQHGDLPRRSPVLEDTSERDISRVAGY